MSYKKFMFDSQKRGDEAECRFVNLAKKLGYECVIHNDRKSQLIDHIDVTVLKGEKSASVDIKSKKRISRKDGESTDDIIWLEFKNVRGNNGWLFGSADFIAFENTKGFNLFHRETLVEWAKSNIDFVNTANKSTEAYKKIYTRKDRKDQISFVRFSDIKHLVHYSIE